MTCILTLNLRFDNDLWMVIINACYEDNKLPYQWQLKKC